MEESNSQGMDYKKIVAKKLGEKVNYKLNPDKSYVLCEKNVPEPTLNPNHLVEFLVYDLEQEEIIFTDKIANAKISWYNNTQLLITKQKGYITNPTDTGKWTYIFDLKLKKKITLKKPI